ncbi:nuclear transport factor 2 family protein [Roseivirga sp.]|uniref:nuclear transport factor 2 family protein n=1 Tax=Roseivirga sp. TaxID=1964215 RepID=UPI003B8DF346
MRVIYYLVVLVLSSNLYAQNGDKEAINKDVWYNFMQAYQDLDASLFNQIHTDDVVRVLADQKELLNGQEYKDKNLDNFNRWNSQRLKQRIDFSFYDRIQKGNTAYETGIYKITRYQGGKSKSFYGKFNVMLKKVAGIWKISMDRDTSENNTIDETDFEKGDVLTY